MTPGSHDSPRRHRRAEIATFLSFLWPGLGQWYGDRPRAAALFGVPLAVVVGLLGLAAVLDVQRVALWLFRPGIALAAAIVIVVAGAWRLASMVDANRSVGGRAASRGRPLLVLAVLGVACIAVHLGLAAIAYGFHTAQQRIFVADPISPPPPPSLPPARTPAPGETRGPDPTPLPTEGPPGRINVLFTGIDSSPTRDHALTDTLIVVSLDPVTRDLAMVSFPRDIANFPLSNGRTFTGKINGLLSYAQQHPEEFPDGPLASVTRELGNLLGIPIEYYAAINLGGFQRMIDEVGGVTIVNERAINDPGYGGWTDGRISFHLPAGRHTLDGATALAYARSRKGLGDSDFSRARRQQQLLLALQAKLTDPSMLPRLTSILDAAADTVTTNFPADRLAEMLELGREVDQDRIKQFVLGPPYATNPPPSTTGGLYTLRLDFTRVARLSVELFGEASRYAAR